MKVLWITGMLLPEATAKIKGEPAKEWNGTGSWLLGAAVKLTKRNDIQLYMAATSQDVKQLTRVETDRITTYAIPYGKGHFTENAEYEPYMVRINEEVQPDVVHIHGTEYSHSWAYLKVCGGHNVVISIQGMTSVCWKYYRGGLTLGDILFNTSFRDVIRGGILREQRSFRKRGEMEQAMIRSVNHVIGRTSWDRAHSLAINPEVIYHHGGETLRSEFYTGEHWNYELCLRHTIFTSQAYYPLKGLHMLIKAMPHILKQFPDTQLRVAGFDPTLGYQKSQWWRRSGYGKYLISLIRNLSLLDHIAFIGPQDTIHMKTELLNSNVFVCPSSIENSPNSLGEAQILGVPCVASYVGGVMDMMEGDEEHLYRYDDIEMLAEKVCGIFQAGTRQTDMSEKARNRHDPEHNVMELIGTYREISSQDTMQ